MKPWETAYEALIDALREAADLAERYQDIKDLEARFTADMRQLKADVANGLYEEHTWAQVGEILGVSGARAEQISRASR